jgi:hypothetical protein
MDRLSSEGRPGFTSVGSKRRPVFSSWGGKRDIFASGISGSKTEPAFWILNPKPDTETNTLGAISDPAFRIMGNHDYAPFGILGKSYEPILGNKMDSWGGKRDPAFYSWGGKRDAEIPNWEHKYESTKRGAQFSSWGGKRDFHGDENEKRDFSNWGGKRNYICDITKEDAEETGKREAHEENSARNGTTNCKEEQVEERKEAYRRLLEELDSKTKLGSGNSKEFMGNSEETEAECNTDTCQPDSDNELDEGDVNTGVPGAILKRSYTSVSERPREGKALFSPWGGKRSHESPSLFSILGSMHTWHDPPLLSDLFKKRGSAHHETPGFKKWGSSPAGAVFSSWGGKRSDNLTGRNKHKTPPQGTGRQLRRGADFYSWGGKR